jgi:ABC-type antimicrobial peptide transport system permease subunit
VLDVGIRVVAVLEQSMPSFWVAMLLMLILAVYLRLFPVSGLGVKNIVLPTITLTFFQMAILLRLVRSEMLEVMHQDYIRTARAKGLSELWVTIQHALKNAAIPVITVMGLQFGGAGTRGDSGGADFRLAGLGMAAGGVDRGAGFSRSCRGCHYRGCIRDPGELGGGSALWVARS